MLSNDTRKNSFLSDAVPASPPSSSLVNTSPPRALVILFGWWGAHTRHLTKYADLYRQRKCLTIQAVANPIAILFLHQPTLDSCARHAAKLAALALSQYPDIPIIIHVFSNGGAFVLDRMESLIQTARREEGDDKNSNTDLLLLADNLVGYIFDSAPAYPDTPTALRALKYVCSTKWSYLLASILFRLFIFLTQTLPELLLFSTTTMPNSSFRKGFWNRIKYSKVMPHVKQGFIYSLADQVTNAKHLEELIAVRKDIVTDATATSTAGSTCAADHGVLVLRLQDSPHVQHLRAYPKEYNDFIDTFLKAAGI